MNNQQYSALVEEIYDAALNPDLWSTVLKKLKDAFDSTAAGFFLETAEHRLIWNHIEGLDPEQMDLYGAHFAKKNPWFTIPGLMRPGRVLTDLSLEVIHKDKNAFVKTEMYQDWCKKQDYRHLMGGNLLDRHGNLLNFSFFRPEHSGYFTQKEKSEYRSLSRHLIKAVEINARVEGLQLRLSANESVLNKLRMGVVGLDSAGRIVYMNEYAGDIFCSGEGVFEHGCRIKIENGGDCQAFNKAIGLAGRARQSSSLLVSRRTRSALSVSIIPAAEQRQFLAGDGISVMVFLTDPDDRSISDSRYLRERWRLSPLESRFTSYLLKGKTVAQIAGTMKLTKNTAQWYSKQILQKCGVKRQSELILKLMGDLSAFIR